MGSVFVTSYTQLHRLWTCPFQYYLKYIKWIKVVYADSTGTVPGLIIHDLAHLFFLSKGDWSIFDRLFDTYFEKYITQPYVFLREGQFARTKDEAFSKISKYRDNFVRELVKQNLVKAFFISEGRFGEFKAPFLLRPDIGICGGWDLLTADSKESPFILVDFKASDSPFNLDKRQLYFYALGIQRQLGFSISLVAFLLFKTASTYYYQCTPEILQETEDWIVKCKSIVEANQFNPSSSKYSCNLCDYNHICEFAFSKQDLPKVEGPVPFLPHASL